MKKSGDILHLERETGNQLSIRFWLLGFLPLVLFLARLSYFLDVKEPGCILWICHISNLLLALGLFMGQKEFMRISAFWHIIGVPLWIWDMMRFGMRTFTTFSSHIGGLIVGLFVLSRVGCGKRSWLYAMIWFLIVQQVCRMVTSDYLNVNIAHCVYRGWETMFTNYWIFWAITTVGAGVVLWGVGKVLVKLFPPRE